MVFFEVSGVNTSASTALGITDTILGFIEARSTVFSLLNKGNQITEKTIHYFIYMTPTCSVQTLYFSKLVKQIIHHKKIEKTAILSI